MKAKTDEQLDQSIVQFFFHERRDLRAVFGWPEASVDVLENALPFLRLMSRIRS
jgi:hypothetical protein